MVETGNDGQHSLAAIVVPPEGFVGVSCARYVRAAVQEQGIRTYKACLGSIGVEVAESVFAVPTARSCADGTKG